jgi:hypothetical protein
MHDDYFAHHLGWCFAEVAVAGKMIQVTIPLNEAMLEAFIVRRI